MLVEFSVENFRSIKGKVTLSAVASRGRAVKVNGELRRPDDEITAPVPVPGRDFELLPVLAIYGANASGKSNVLLAMNALLRSAVYGESELIDGRRSLEPFAFDKETLRSPTRFQLQLALESGLYTYTLSLDEERIHEESLMLIPAVPNRNMPHPLFMRHWNPVTDKTTWEMGKRLYGNQKQLHVQIQDTLNHNLPYLSQMRKLTVFPDDIQNWFMHNATKLIEGWRNSEFQWAVHDSLTNPKRLERNTKLIGYFDTGIVSMQVKPRDGSPGSGAKVFSTHRNAGGEVQLPFKAESTGTQRLFELGNLVIEQLRTGGLVMVDELSANIHPYIAREIVRLFQSSKINLHHAQLIFTSHDLTLWQNDLLRRDQFWLTEKDAEGATRLYPLSDYKIRNDLSIGKAYLDARFGAVPMLADEDEFARLINEN